MSPAFKIYQDEQGSWHWQLQAGDGQVEGIDLGA